MTVNNRAESLLSTFLSFVPLLCASMVVGIHSYGAGELPVWTVTSRVAGFFAHGLFMTAVPIFMMISGYLFYRNVREMRQIWDKQKRRCASILVPYLSWTVFYYIVYAMADRWGMLNNSVEFNLNGLLKAVTCYQYVFPFWFMSQLIIYIILAPVIFLTLKRKATSMVVLAIMTLLGLLGWKWNENLSGLDRMVFAPNFFCYYYLGAYLAGHAESLARGLQKLMRIPVWLGVIGLIGSCMLESYIFDTHAVFNDRLVVPVIVLLSLSLLFHAAARWGGKQLLRFPLLRVQTMVVYGVHPIVGMIVVMLIGANTNLLQMFVLFLGTFIISCICAMIVSRIPVLNCLFNGGRKER